MPQHGFDKNLIRRIFFFNIQRGDPLDFQKRFLQCRGVIFQKKKFCVFGSLSNMSKNGLRMVVCLNFDITHLSPPSTNVMINIFTRTSSPSICPNCSLSQCISSPPAWLVRMPSPSLTQISITSIQQQHLPGVCIYLSPHQSPARGGVSPPGVAMGEEAASGKEKMEETRQLMVLVPAQASPGQPRPGLLIVTLCLMCLVSHINTNTTII